MNHQPRFYKWELLAILWVAYFLNQGDRQIYSAVLPLIKADLGVSDVHLGLVVTVFTLLYGAFVPLAGCLGDFVSKKWIVCLSLLTFSVGTLFTGFSGGLLGLILFRSVATGVGEAFYYPAANSLIGQYHHKTRAQAMAVHQSSLYVGIVASSWIAGWVGERHGWQATFYTFGAFGLLMVGVVAIRLRNERHDDVVAQPAAQPSEPPMRLGEVLHRVLRTPTLYFLSVAFGGMVFVGVGFQTWMPTFLYEKASPEFSVGEFSGNLTTQGLLEAIAADGIAVPEAPSQIGSLNRLLSGDSLHQRFKRISPSKEANELIGRVSNLSAREHIRLNRLTLEAAYPERCPKNHLLADAALNSMLWHYIFAFIGVMVGGRVSDRLAERRKTIRMEVEYLGLLGGAPFIWLMGASSDLTVVYVALGGFGFFRGLYDSNLFAALFDVIPPRYRSSATGLMLCCAFTVGSTSPMLLGYLKQHINLGIGLSSLGFVYLLGAVVIFASLRLTFAKDYCQEAPEKP